MRRIVIFLSVVLCFSLSGKVQAQRVLPGMRGIQITGGITDGFYSSSNKSETGYYFGAALSTYAKNANKWVFGIEFMNRYCPYKEKRIPISQFTAEGGYYKNVLSDASKTFFLSVGGSALTGYETVNCGQKTLYDGSTIRNKDRFLYGGAFTLEVETYLTDKIVLLLTGRERILWGTTSGHFHTQFGIGIKFMIH
ncbi:MAG: conjugal transfer protein TraO [Tannerellaceae bacterium]|nr:conjugal transfer protein TraO [Tannerellaceae bacterium]